jgi:hypothetical protein
MIWWITILIIIIGLWGFTWVKRTSTHHKAIGSHVTVNYFDQNFDFESIFPATGTITRQIYINNTVFFVVLLEKTFIYYNTEYKDIIIKERHAGQFIGSTNEIHIHVLLPKVTLEKDQYKFDDFEQVVWATVKCDR